jgi:hypothetical protein
MRLVEFNTELLDKKLQDLDIKGVKNIPARIMIDLDQVTVFRETYLDDEDEDSLGQAVIVYFISGDDFWLSTSYEDFVKLMKK